MKNRALLSAIGASLFLSVQGQAMATNGYFSHGYGPVSKSLAGACVAMTNSAMCSAHNPATLISVGNRWEVGAALFAPKRGFAANDDFQTPPYASIPAGNYESGNDYFLIPHFAYARQLDADTAIGLIVGGQGGMNTEYDSAVFQNFNSPGNVASSPVGMDLIQMFAGLNFAKRLSPQHSVAIMPVLAVQRLKVQGLEPFRPFSSNPDQVTNNGSSWSRGGGVRVGWLWQPDERLAIGASYQSKLWMTAFDEYKGLLAEGGDFDIPPMFDLGFAYKFVPKWTLAFDYQRIQNEQVASLGNAADLAFVPGDILLGTNDGLGFGWKDIDVYKLGLQWEYRPDLTFRAGFGYTSDTFEGSQALFNILAPAVVKRHFTFGIGKRLDSGKEINLAVMYAPEHRLSGTNPNTGPQTGHVEMSQWDIELGATFEF